VRYEDVSGPIGDDPQDRELWRREAYPVEERPTRAECDQDERELLRFARYDDGRGL
jgi:hypothetical protein